MILESMVLSRDWQEVSVLECILGSLRIGVDVESEPDKAREKLSRSKIDAIIVDCDLSGASRFLKSLPTANMAQNSVPLMVIRGGQNRQNLSQAGADFVFEKPISVEVAVRTLSAARNLILQGRLRYHRQALEVPVTLLADGKRLRAQLVNVSQGGIGVHLSRPVSLAQTVSMRFDLPKGKCSIKTQGEVVWSDKLGNAGIRFVELPGQKKQDLELWLAGQYFTD
jgi:hypothetical protein